MTSESGLAHAASSARGPAQPSYIFRGHTVHIHSVEILRRNTCLLTGDADGWVVLWKLETKRAVAVWKAHDAAILGTAEWGPDKIITHGRDNTLRVWQLSSDTANYSAVLPADGLEIHRPKPWLLHSLPVNTLNFCAFSMCRARSHPSGAAPQGSPAGSSESIYIAVPGRDDKKVEVYQLPNEKIVCVVPKVGTSESGMVMAVKLVHHQPSNNVLVLVGYENGVTAAHIVPQNATLDLAETIYLSQPHSQPVLSLDALPDGTTYFTSSADAIIAAHQIPELPSREAGSVPSRTLAPGSSPSLPPNADAISTASSTPESQPQADPPNPPADPLTFTKTPLPPTSTATPSTLSCLLATPSPSHPAQPPTAPPQPLTLSTPLRTINTKHAGQQSLRVRSDGRLLVTAGWDARVRIYSARTLKEVAVLKWHRVGVHAVDFGDVLSEGEGEGDRDEVEGREGQGEGRVTARLGPKETGLGRLQRMREREVQRTHWVVAGAKDGKLSLWNVF